MNQFTILIPLMGISCGILAILGWVLTTWMRIRHGYPLDNMGNGAPIYPHATGELVERTRLIAQENAQLRAELGQVKDRLATVERIVTDRSYRLDREIEGLRGQAN